MNILFVHSLDNINTAVKPLTTPEQMQFGSSYISAFLKKQGHKAKLVILSKGLGYKTPNEDFASSVALHC